MIPKTKPIKRANIITIFLNIPISVLVFVLKTGMAIIAIKTKATKKPDNFSFVSNAVIRGPKTTSIIFCLGFIIF